jgi:hypothetical protein
MGRPLNPLEAAAQATAITPTWRQKSAGLLQDALENIVNRYRARQISETLFGGQSSNLPLQAGLLDLTPLGYVFARQEESNNGTLTAPGAPSGLLNALGPMVKTADAARKAVGYERGYYRGGPKIQDARKSGNWYTTDKAEAADYAKRFGAAGEVREYALPGSGFLRADRSYDNRLAMDVAAKAEGLGPQGVKAADLIRKSYVDGARPSGMEIWRGLEKSIGEEAAAGIMQSLGFRGAVGMKAPQYTMLFGNTMPRDASRAAFDPTKMHLDNIFAGAGGMGLLGAVLGNQADE